MDHSHAFEIESDAVTVSNERFNAGKQNPRSWERDLLDLKKGL